MSAFTWASEGECRRVVVSARAGSGAVELRAEWTVSGEWRTVTDAVNGVDLPVSVSLTSAEARALAVARWIQSPGGGGASLKMSGGLNIASAEGASTIVYGWPWTPIARALERAADCAGS